MRNYPVSVPNKSKKATSIYVYDPYADEGWFVDSDPVPVSKGNAEMKVTWDIKNTLIASARKELDEAKKAHATALEAVTKADLAVREKEIVLDWATGLLVGADLMMKPAWDKPAPKAFIRKLYYVPSRSGRKYGHYIEVTDNDVSCTCPGFLNRHYCHATREVQANNGIYRYIWLGSVNDFNKNRDAAMANSRGEK